MLLKDMVISMYEYKYKLVPEYGAEIKLICLDADGNETGEVIGMSQLEIYNNAEVEK